ncbi:Protein of unknown function [Amycolatopsis arida]|uniref:DUF2993 domain-containing protein n=1 Tax=Amycolatopsis arida TaxID=587909 RepID=A0A1I5SUR3_9PSEU|nr:DUF2993 domain-containing protein [Amycolatopsis arida]TDX96339.1 Protein of unknown function (DUF2993) [Amycolatopsis arida]SFP74512.1 Protein of unknown function [Amycolatopsis arida]
MSSPVTQRDRRPPARPRRRSRRGRTIAIVAAVLVGLLVAADFGLAAMAEHTVSQKAREQLGLAHDPSVTVHGFPFTVQALSGDYRHISVHATGIPVGDTLRDLEVDAELRHVDAPLSDLLNGNVQQITIGEVEGSVRIKATDIARVDPLSKIENLRIEPASEEYVRRGEGTEEDRDALEREQEAEDDATAGVRLSGEADIAGDRVEIVTLAMIELDGNRVRITPHWLQFGNGRRTTVVPPQVQQALLPNFEADINARQLPFTVTPTAVRVESGAIVVKGKAENVAFAGM